MANYLETVGPTFRFRRDYPSDVAAELTDLIGRPHWRFRLDTSDPGQAQAMADDWALKTDLLIRAARRAKTSRAPVASLRTGRVVLALEELRALPHVD